ncbi:MAG: hypothetical protein ACOC93_01520 [Planctomycetota bacterium]
MCFYTSREHAGTTAVQLIAESKDKVRAKMLWNDRKGPKRMVIEDGLLYGFVGRGGDKLQVRDLMTGEKLSEVRAPLVPHHFSAIAGGYLFAMDYDGKALVATTGKEPEIVGVSRLGMRGYKKYDYFNQGSQPFFSGNRIFMNSYTDVYCVGNPDEHTRLSEAHR